MVTGSVEILGPLAFVVVLEMAHVARDTPLVGHDGETERMDYDGVDDDGRVVGVVTRLAKRLRYGGPLASAGGFHVVFVLTELVLYGSILVVYLTNAPFFDRAIEGEGTAGAVVAFLSLVWLLLPVIVVDRYGDLARRGISPLSVDVHIATTLSYLVLVVAAGEGQYLVVGALALAGVPEVHRFTLLKVLLGAFVGTGAALLRYKSRLYRRFLRAELRRLRETPGGTDAWPEGTGPDGGTGSNEDTESGVVADGAGDPDGEVR